MNIVQFNLFLSQILTVLSGLGLILEGYIGGTNSLVQTGLNRKDRSFAVFDSQNQKTRTAGLVFSSLSLVWFQSFCSLETGLSNTSDTSDYKIYMDRSGHNRKAGASAVLYRKGELQALRSLTYHLGDLTRHTINDVELVSTLLAAWLA